MGPEGALLALLGRYGLGADWLFPVEMLLAVRPYLFPSSIF